jgi:hypothetical protein
MSEPNETTPITKPAVEASAAAPVLTAYKGFNLDFSCRGMQYKLGETFEHVGPVEACESGLHSCENPLDIFEYYAPGTSIYAEVEASGEIARHGDDSKVASARLRVKAVLALPDFIGRALDWLKAHCAPATSNHATGHRSASSATGDSSASSATGDRSASSATGDSSASSATGYSSASSATGYSSASSATGYSSASSATGIAAVALNTGRFGRARAGKEGAIVLCEHDDNGKLLHIRASKVGENGIEPDVYYTLQGGEFVRGEQS